MRKQQSMGSQYSVRSSRKSKSNKASRSIKAEVEQRLGSGFLNFNLGGHTSNVEKMGKTSGAAAEPEEPRNEPKEIETTKLALAYGAAREPSLRLNSFKPGPTSVVERLQRGCTSQTLLEAGKSDQWTQVAKARVKSGIKVKFDSGQRNGGSVSCPPILEGITPNPFWNIAQEGTGMSRSQGLRHANQSRTQEKQELGHPHEPPSSRKDFLDEAVLIGYDGSNMPYVMFKNQIMKLMERCPYPAARGTGVWGRSPQRSKILHFFARIT